MSPDPLASMQEDYAPKNPKMDRERENDFTGRRRKGQKDEEQSRVKTRMFKLGTIPVTWK